MPSSKPKSYEHSFATHPRAVNWDQVKNGDKKPSDFTICSTKKCWFKCDKCPHSFDSSLDNINRGGTWCPYCNSNKLCDDKECKICYNKSFATHPRAVNWNQVKNGDKTPRDFTIGSTKKCWFKCDKCPHSFSSRLDLIKSGRWCPYCSSKKLCDDKECKICYNKSFACSPRAVNWDSTKNGDKTPRDIFKASTKKCWFKCDKCHHSFQTRLEDITLLGNWCPYCANKNLCDDKECKTCYNKSLASHPRAAHYHPTENGNITPRDVFKKARKKYCFICPYCNNNYYASPRDVTRGTWCPCLKKKTEAKFYQFLLENKKIFNIKSIKRNFRPKWANLKKTHNTSYEYDFYIVLNNGVEIIIEIDGPQHYKQVSNWAKPLHNQIRDKIKEMLAEDQDINVLRLNQEDIFKNMNDWKKNFIDFVNNRYIDNNNSIHRYDCSHGYRYNNSTNTNSD